MTDDQIQLSDDLWARLGRAETHALRPRILKAIEDGEASSPLELSRALKERLGNVAYHVKQLHRAGLIELEKTEPRRGAVEHFYRVAA